MIKVHFKVKRKTGENKETLGKIISVGFHIIDQPKVQNGVVRLTKIPDDKFRRLNNNQLVITTEGLGIVKDYIVRKDDNDNTIPPTGVNVKLLNTRKDKFFYNLNHIQVIDVIEIKSGARYPALESDYPLLLVDDAPVEFVLDSHYRANLSLESRHKYNNVKLFAKEANSIKLLYRLIESGIWNPIGK